MTDNQKKPARPRPSWNTSSASGSTTPLPPTQKNLPLILLDSAVIAVNVDLNREPTEPYADTSNLPFPLIKVMRSKATK